MTIVDAGKWGRLRVELKFGEDSSFAGGSVVIQPEAGGWIVATELRNAKPMHHGALFDKPTWELIEETVDSFHPRQ